MSGQWPQQAPKNKTATTSWLFLKNSYPVHFCTVLNECKNKNVNNAVAPTPYFQYRFAQVVLYLVGCGWYIMPNSIDHRTVCTQVMMKMNLPIHRCRKLKCWYDTPVINEKMLSLEDRIKTSGTNAKARHPVRSPLNSRNPIRRPGGLVGFTHTP